MQHAELMSRRVFTSISVVDRRLFVFSSDSARFYMSSTAVVDSWGEPRAAPLVYGELAATLERMKFVENIGRNADYACF